MTAGVSGHASLHQWSGQLGHGDLASPVVVIWWSWSRRSGPGDLAGLGRGGTANSVVVIWQTWAMSDQAEVLRNYWTDRGRVWVDHRTRLDSMLAPLGEAAIARLHPGGGENLLDIGCGTGSTSLELARLVGGSGQVTGVDISAPMVAEARRRATEAGVTNLSFVVADAGAYEFEPRLYDAAFSRMGIMFFAEPVAGFTNLRRALRPGGQLSFVCWRSPGENSWVTEPGQAVAEVLGPPEPVDPDAPGPFSLASADRISSTLTGAGLVDIDITPHDLPLSVGDGTTDELVRYYIDLLPGTTIPENAEVHVIDRIKAALGTMVERRRTPDGIVMGAAAWLVSARA
ncbi:class I SAM-dependent methyltransferase [Candidatus Poriferisocius sp.]|uniref:class I SAM-dependent methyltransferase n=1 Tax=Candidatus Poriferisocius sp. TaxID=3101276 RepID=UPI003B02833F